MLRRHGLRKCGRYGGLVYRAFCEIHDQVDYSRCQALALSQMVSISLFMHTRKIFFANYASDSSMGLVQYVQSQWQWILCAIFPRTPNLSTRMSQMNTEYIRCVQFRYTGSNISSNNQIDPLTML